MENNLIGILTRHGVDNYAWWQPGIPADDPLLLALLDKYENNDGSVRGNGDEIRKVLCSAVDDGKPCVHVILYYDPDYEYVGCDVFDSFDAALRQFDSRLNDIRAEYPNDPSWIKEVERNPEKLELHFRKKEQSRPYQNEMPAFLNDHSMLISAESRSKMHRPKPSVLLRRAFLLYYMNCCRKPENFHPR